MYYAILYLTLVEEDEIRNRMLIRGILTEFEKMGFSIVKIVISYEVNGDYLLFRETLLYAKRRKIDYVVSICREMIHPKIREVFNLLTEARCQDITLITFLDGDLVNNRSKFLQIEDSGVEHE
ncbi:MAG: hypothetical protein RR700_06165 [Anaerorhabdus sp.]|uniref:hypothetical protein n=1 Tax=Anaerorhabdus sp. TaxID=1872524 RepID=UPI002FCA2BEF